MAQHAILRFEKHKGHPAGPLEAHHERKKEQYASNPDIDTSRSKYNFHIVKPEGRYYHFIQSRIEQAGCRTRKDSTRFVDTLITASPEFFKGKSPKEIAAYFQRAADFLIDRVGRENIVSAVVHMDEKTPHLHLVFVPLTKDNRLCAKEKAKEITFSDLTLEEARQLHTFDEYFKGETAFERAGKKITPKLLLEAIRTLPEEKRKAVLLYYFEGMNDTEIAELFDTSRSTIQYRRTSSFELLKKYLEENADEWDEW